MVVDFACRASVEKQPARPLRNMHLSREVVREICCAPVGTCPGVRPQAFLLQFGTCWPESRLAANITQAAACGGIGPRVALWPNGLVGRGLDTETLASSFWLEGRHD